MDPEGQQPRGGERRWQVTTRTIYAPAMYFEWADQLAAANPSFGSGFLPVFGTLEELQAHYGDDCQFVVLTFDVFDDVDLN